MDYFLAFLFGGWIAFCVADSSVTEEQWSKAQELCSSNGGLASYISNTVGDPDITCKNGAKFKLKGKTNG